MNFNLNFCPNSSIHSSYLSTLSLTQNISQSLTHTNLSSVNSSSFSSKKQTHNLVTPYTGTFNIEDIQDVEQIDTTLHVISVISNPCNYKRRVKLMKEFIHRMEQTKYITLYIVEILYPKYNTDYFVTQPDHPRHLQLKSDSVLWTKENAFNIAVRNLCPKEAKAFALLDGDLTFEQEDWVFDSLKALNFCDILQPFSIGIDLNPKGEKPKYSCNTPIKKSSACFLY